MADGVDELLRAEWRDLVGRKLPDEAARRGDWPIRFDHCFARVLLDNAHDGPWRDFVEPPAWRNTPAPKLAAAIDLGRKVLDGRADLRALNDRSLRLRGKDRPHSFRSR